MDCCSELIQILSRAELKFIPAVFLAILFSTLIITYLYSKKRKLSYYMALKNIFHECFVALPQPNHPDFSECKNANCAKCKKSHKVRKVLFKSWEGYKLKASTLCRIDAAVENMKQPDLKNKSEQNPTIFKMKLTGNPWWNDFDVYESEKQLLKINFNVIQQEFDNIFKRFEHGNTEGWKLNDIPKGHWCLYPLFDQGQMNEENAIKCPNTTALISSLPSFMNDCVFGNACFSLIYPDSQVEPHYGPTNIRLRCHLGLRIPQDCYLEVNGTQSRWKEGETLIFDDSYQHSAYYGSVKTFANPRVILLIDFWHPNLSNLEKEALRHILPPI